MDGVYQESVVGDGVLHLVDGKGKEPAVEVAHPQQPLDVQLGHRWRELPDGRPLGVYCVT